MLTKNLRQFMIKQAGVSDYIRSALLGATLGGGVGGLGGYSAGNAAQEASEDMASYVNYYLLPEIADDMIARNPDIGGDSKVRRAVYNALSDSPLLTREDFRKYRRGVDIEHHTTSKLPAEYGIRGAGLGVLVGGVGGLVHQAIKDLLFAPEDKYENDASEES